MTECHCCQLTVDDMIARVLYICVCVCVCVWFCAKQQTGAAWKLIGDANKMKFGAASEGASIQLLMQCRSSLPSSLAGSAFCANG
jgi:hypothetical protein